METKGTGFQCRYSLRKRRGTLKLKMGSICRDRRMPLNHRSVLTREGKRLGPTMSQFPPEVLLQIFSWLSVPEVCLRVAPVCRRWRQLARHPCLWLELVFCAVSPRVDRARVLLHRAPLLRRLELHGREDGDQLLTEVCMRTPRLESLVLRGCRGTPLCQDMSADVLTSVLYSCPKLSSLELKDTTFKSCDFYRILGQMCARFNHVNLKSASKEEVLCFLETCLESPASVSTQGILDGRKQELSEMIKLFQETHIGISGGLLIVDNVHVRKYITEETAVYT